MSAIALEERMAVEDRITKLEANVGHLRSDVTAVKTDLKELRSELGGFRKDLSAEISAIKADLATFKVQSAETTAIKADLSTFKVQMAAFQTDMAKEFGSVRVQLETNKLWMLVTGVATIVSMITAAATLVRVLKLGDS
jgi:septal ring factor EnvC (AmiA/AmiB activator)